MTAPDLGSGCFVTSTKIWVRFIQVETVPRSTRRVKVGENDLIFLLKPFDQLRASPSGRSLCQLT